MMLYKSFREPAGVLAYEINFRKSNLFSETRSILVNVNKVTLVFDHALIVPDGRNGHIGHNGYNGHNGHNGRNGHNRHNRHISVWVKAYTQRGYILVWVPRNVDSVYLLCPLCPLR